MLLALAVAMGAFGAHALKEKLDAYSLAVYEKAAFYHFVHALGLLLVALLAAQISLEQKWTTIICSLLFAGVVVFSGSLYLLAITGVKWLGAITPIGGTMFIAAWLILAIKAYSS